LAARDPQKKGLAIAMNRNISAYRGAILAISLSLVAHLAAVLAMLLVLGPGLDTEASALERANYVAGHPWLWRLGWIPWQLTAASDLAVSITLLNYVRTLPGRPGFVAAVFGIFATIVAVIPDQWGEAILITQFLADAQSVAAGTGDLVAYVALEARLLDMTGTFGAGAYTLMTAAWLFTVAQSARVGRVHSKFIYFGLMVCLFFGVTVFANALSTRGATVEGGYPGFAWVYTFNALGFSSLMIWMAWMAVVLEIGHSHRNPSEDQALHRLRWPAPGIVGHLAEFVASRGIRDLVRAVCPWAPTMKSDITDVVYLNWLVPTERVKKVLPAPLQPQTLGDYTVITVLSYQHGHFGPSLAGPLRRVMPSPAQSNWRFYVESEQGRIPPKAIYFFKTVVSHPEVVVGSRLFADGLPSHAALELSHRRDGATIQTRIIPGDGSAPDLDVVVRSIDTKSLPAEWNAHFETWQEAVRYLVEQNSAVSVSAEHHRLCVSHIDIPMQVETIQPSEVELLESDFLKDLIFEAPVFAFIVPAVGFRATGEEWTDLD
jgi:uncharacterized protein YqjF (DUF2071 family)